MEPIYIKEGEIYTNPIKYILSIMNKSLDLNFSFVTNKETGKFVFDHTDEKSIEINHNFYKLLLIDKKYEFDNYFLENPIIYFPESEKEDWLGSAFYIINCFQEFGSLTDEDKNDQFGRFRYTNSFQYEHNCIEENLVQKYFIKFCQQELVINVEKGNLKPTKLFLSHDIDSVNGSFLQDGFWAIKRGRFDIVLKLVFNEIFRKPDWKNIDLIQSIHSESGLKNTFFWLATNRKGSFNVENADYNLDELKYLSTFSLSNGLHKSSSPAGFSYELSNLPFNTNINRYHFLMFNVPAAWDHLQESSIMLDASLGFAERFGFRNGYGLPFRPYNLKTDLQYDFIEVPLNVMDGTFYKYMNIPVDKTADLIINFLEKNKLNSIVSILWHNTFFTNYKYKGYLDEYKKILTYILESNLKSVSPQEIINEYGK